jgi:hypothetical protein
MTRQCKARPLSSHQRGTADQSMHRRSHSVAEIEDCAIAVDASYYLQLFLDNPPYHEPLLSALGGLTGIQSHIEEDLDQWKAHRIEPLFVFNGQVVTGQDDITTLRGRLANEKTDQAWELYFNGRANEAVAGFGNNSSTLAGSVCQTLGAVANCLPLRQARSVLKRSTPSFRTS